MYIFPSFYQSDCEICHFTSKLIDVEKDKLKSFIAFKIVPIRPILRTIVESQIMVPLQSHLTTMLLQLKPMTLAILLESALP